MRVPQTASLKFDGAPRYKAQDITYFGKGLSVAVLSNDEHSGVKSVYYALGHDDTKEYKNSSFPSQKVLIDLTMQQRTRVGYRSRILANYFTVDTSSPTSARSYENNHIKNLFRKNGY